MDDLSVFAAAIADPIDRVRIKIAHETANRALPVMAELGMTMQAGQVFGMLRNLGANRRVTRAQVERLFVYQPSVAAEGLPVLAETGLVDGDDLIGLTSAGLDAIHTIQDASAAVIAQLWGDREVDFASLGALAQRVISAHLDHAGPAFAVMAPMHVRPGTTAEAAFAEMLTPLRFIRFDAHIEAWEAEGLTVHEVQALEAGESRSRIEAETNRRAGGAYAVLTDTERTNLLDALLVLSSPA